MSNAVLHAPERPAAPPRRRGLRVLLAVCCVLWTAVVLGSCVLVLLPVVGDLGVLISILTTSGSPLMVVPGLLGVLLFLLVRRVRWRIGSLVVGAVSVLAFAMAVVPLISSAPVAAENGVALRPGQYVSSPPPRPPPDATEVYATVDGTALRLDVHRPRRPAPGRPALVWVHGGGWVEGARGSAPDMLTRFTEQGFTVFDIDYRLSPPPHWADQTREVKCALGRVVERYGVDPQRLSIGGESAGGNLAMLAAYTADTGEFPPSCPVPEVHPRSVVSYYGPTDTAALARDTGTPTALATIGREHLGGSPAEVPQRYAATSPLTHVRPGLPPTLLIHGTADHLVPADQSTRMAAALDRVGVGHRLLLLPWADHAFDRTWGMWSTQIAYGVTAQFLHEHAGGAVLGSPPAD